LHFSIQEYQERLSKVRQEMAREGADVLLVVKPQNIFYLSGCRTYGGALAPDLLVVPSDGPMKHVTRAFEVGVLRTFSWVEDIRAYKDTEDPFLVLRDTLAETKAKKQRIGVELNSAYFPALTLEKVRSIVPGAEFKDVSNLIGNIRLIKSEKEIQYVREAARLADLGMRAGINAVKEGVYEYEVMAEIFHALFKNGQDDVSTTVLVISGPNSGLAHCSHHDRKIGKGDPVLIEHGGCCHLYCSNVLRTVFVGEPSKRIRAMYEAAAKAHDLAIQAVRPGVRAEEIDMIAHRVIEDAGFGEFFVRRTGYALGITAQPDHWIEPLNLLKGDSHVLQPGMVLSIEPGPSVFGEGGCSIGDNVLVTKEGYEYLTTPSKDMVIR
jgi:Xaa-Pro dipeptidase